MRRLRHDLRRLVANCHLYTAHRSRAFSLVTENAKQDRHMYINRTAASNVNGIIGACLVYSRNEAGRSHAFLCRVVAGKTTPGFKLMQACRLTHWPFFAPWTHQAPAIEIAYN